MGNNNKGYQPSIMPGEIYCIDESLKPSEVLRMHILFLENIKNLSCDQKDYLFEYLKKTTQNEFTIPKGGFIFPPGFPEKLKELKRFRP